MIALLTSGCATVGFGPEVHWYRADEPAAKSYVWRTVPRAEMYSQCLSSEALAPHLAACAWNRPGTGTCEVISRFSEATARLTISQDGEDLFCHELHHCAGWRHVTPEVVRNNSHLAYSLLPAGGEPQGSDVDARLFLIANGCKPREETIHRASVDLIRKAEIARLSRLDREMAERERLVARSPQPPASRTPGTGSAN